ncbi:hypothetical protein CE153_03365 [Bifidobacterium sp. N4G05]|nr:hypothetical protein CE153_03365 [Bifidobacterium sp. N4G05]
MGADTQDYTPALIRNLNGEFDETDMELRPEFRKVESSEDGGVVTIHAIEIDDWKTDGLEDIKKEESTHRLLLGVARRFPSQLTE